MGIRDGFHQLLWVKSVFLSQHYGECRSLSVGVHRRGVDAQQTIYELVKVIGEVLRKQDVLSLCNGQSNFSGSEM